MLKSYVKTALPLSTGTRNVWPKISSVMYPVALESTFVVIVTVLFSTSAVDEISVSFLTCPTMVNVSVVEFVL